MTEQRHPRAQGGTGGPPAGVFRPDDKGTAGQAVSDTRDRPASPFTLCRRAAGVLLHPTSLPGPHGCGDLGTEARRFIDFLHAAGQRWWQMLPVTPPGPGDCPYNSPSALAASPLLIDLEALRDQGLLEPNELIPPQPLREDEVDYRSASAFRTSRLRLAFERSDHANHHDSDDPPWLDGYALYAAIKHAHGGRPWWQWAPALRMRRATALNAARRELAETIAFHRFTQRLISEQWIALRNYAHEHGVGLIGDVPIYVNLDSADVWAHRDLFELDAQGRPRFVSGVPGDAFNADGQKWGHPLYRWERHAATGFAWWIARLRRTLEMFDAIRIDHFQGLARYWAIPAGAPLARRGHWRNGPGGALFAAVRRALGRIELFAEDLGPPCPPAQTLLTQFDTPRMRVLEHAFGAEASEHQPHLIPPRSVAYTSTHDDDTIMGWYDRIAPPSELARHHTGDEHRRLRRWLGIDDVAGKLSQWTLVRLVWQCPADTVITPAQDLLGLTSAGRMNIPGTPEGNWRWRMRDGALDAGIARRLLDLTRYYGRDLQSR